MQKDFPQTKQLVLVSGCSCKCELSQWIHTHNRPLLLTTFEERQHCNILLYQNHIWNMHNRSIKDGTSDINNLWRHVLNERCSFSGPPSSQLPLPFRSYMKFILYTAAWPIVSTKGCLMHKLVDQGTIYLPDTLVSIVV